MTLIIVFMIIMIILMFVKLVNYINFMITRNNYVKIVVLIALAVQINLFALNVINIHNY